MNYDLSPSSTITPSTLLLYIFLYITIWPMVSRVLWPMLKRQLTLPKCHQKCNDARQHALQLRRTECTKLTQIFKSDSDNDIDWPSEETRHNILNLDFEQLHTALQCGELSAGQVIRTYISAAIHAHESLNCCTAFMFERAIKRADSLDEASKAHNYVKGRLFGVPISVKDCIGVSGLSSSLGLAKYEFQDFTKDAEVVRLAEDAGGIVFVKTNVPQTLLSFECENSVHGTTVNPWNKAHVPGGSSGGEAALIAAKASVLGIGTDIAGSVRIPAHFCGIYSFKPTHGRVPTIGNRFSVPGQAAIPGICGPMASSVKALVEFTRALGERHVRDYHVRAVAFDEKEFSSERKLRVGYYVHDGFIEASPACRRAVQLSVDAMKKCGHQVIEWVPPDVPAGILLFLQLINADGLRTVSDQLNGEVRTSIVNRLVTQFQLPTGLKQFVGRILSLIKGWEFESQVAQKVHEVDVNQLWKLHSELSNYSQHVLDSWNAARIDVVLCPANAMPAIELRTFHNIPLTASYTILYSLLNYPAGIVPVTTVTADDQFTTPMPSGLVRRNARLAYGDGSKFVGLPAGVQVVAAPFQGEKVLRAMALLEKQHRFDRHPTHAVV
jgi:Asp-tRNA(Asn)/Glu-tRNA(Gln) amidotransferase A subunit family amidase